MVAEAASLSGWRSITFFDDRWPRHTKIGSWEISGAFRDMLRHSERYDGLFVAVGCNNARWKIFRQLYSSGANLPTIVHPKAVVSSLATIGAGTFLSAHSIIQPGAAIHDYVIINTSTVIEHDCIIETASHICPNVTLAGGVKVGSNCLIGTGASVIPSICIGDGSSIGAGSVVIRDVMGGSVVAGNPAKPI